MYNIAIFASGSGSNALKIIEHFKGSDLAQVSLIVTNRKAAGVLTHADIHQVPSVCFQGAIWKENPSEILAVLRKNSIDFIVLAGFLLKVPIIMVESFQNRIINIHPALLPKYGGKGMYGHFVHEAVKRNGESESGITIHNVNNVYDDGQVLFQAKVDLAPSDSAEVIQQKVLALEHKWFAKVIEQELKKLKAPKA